MAPQIPMFNTPMRIFLLTLILASVGLVTVYSSSAPYAAMKYRVALARSSGGTEILAQEHSYHKPFFFERQCFWLLVGLGAMLFFYKMDYRVLKDQSLWILLVSLVLLLLVFVPGIERPINRHHRWIGLLGFTFQPSELAKLALIVYMARMLTDQHDRLKSLKQGVLPALGLTAIVVSSSSWNPISAPG